MKINIDTRSISPMLQWLKDRKAGTATEQELRSILQMPEYQVELARYADENLPVCTLTLEEVVDFFMTFDSKDPENPRLQYKKPYFTKFYNDMDRMLDKADLFTSMGEKEADQIMDILTEALPDDLIQSLGEFNIILTISIGNSQGYPHENNVVFDVSNMDVFEDREAAVHVLAHEIHHTMFASFLPDGAIDTQSMFIINFAFEGLAMHYCNNAATVAKPKKYPELPEYTVDQKDFALYGEEFEQLFDDFRKDFDACADLEEEEMENLLRTKYETFDYVSRKDGTTHRISQMPTYYLGAHLWGVIDLVYCKETVFDILRNPVMFRRMYNAALAELGIEKYRL